MNKEPSAVNEIKEKLDCLMEEALEAASRNREFDLVKRSRELGLDDKAIHSAQKILDRIDLK